RDAANLTGTVPDSAPPSAPKGATAVADARGNAGVKMAYAAEGTVDPYAGFEMRIAPENITLLAKTSSQPSSSNERTIALKKGDSAGNVLRDLGATPDEVKAITAALGARGRDGSAKEGQRMRVLLSPTADGKRLQPVRVVITGETSIEA